MGPGSFTPDESRRITFGYEQSNISIRAVEVMDSLTLVAGHSRLCHR